MESTPISSRTNKTASSKCDIALVMGSNSDWSTLGEAAQILNELNISHEIKIISAHRTPDRLYQFAKSAETKGIKIIIAGAGGAAHLPGMIASLTTRPVLGVPVRSKTLDGLDSLLSIVQMPAGIPVASLAIGKSGAKNAALYAASMLALSDQHILKKLKLWREKQTQSIPESPL